MWLTSSLALLLREAMILLLPPSYSICLFRDLFWFFLLLIVPSYNSTIRLRLIGKNSKDNKI
ncbi:hypothetical protein WN943_025633 [Citrus x changshan-huyou]